MSERYQHIGLVAVGPRNISSGLEYDNLFPTPDFKQTLLKKDGTIDETVHLMADYIKKYHIDTCKLAQKLKGNSLKDTCDNIWSFVYNHIQYKLDKHGEEQLRRPALLWAYRNSGGDCDCMTIFVCSILYNLKIPFKIRITKYDGKSYFQHVYPIVPINAIEYYTLDCVVSQFNYEKPFSEHKDFNMTTLGIPIVGLHGIPDDLEQLIQGLGAIDDTEQAVYDHLVKTREIITANPGIISKVDNEPSFMEMLDYAIAHFWHPTRHEAFKHLAWNEAMHNQHTGVEEDDLFRDEDEEENEALLGFDDLDGVVDGDDLYDFDGLGKARGARKERKAKRKQQKAVKKIQKKAAKAARKEKKAEKKKAKGFFRKTGVVLANRANKKALLKHNPVIIAQQASQSESEEETQDNSPVVEETPINESSNQEPSAETSSDENVNTTETSDVQDENPISAEDSAAVDNLDVEDENVEGLLGLGVVTKSNEQEIYRHLVSTRNIIKAHPNLIPLEIDYTPGFLDMLNYAIKHFWTPKRDEALKVLAVNEAKLNKANELNEDDLLGHDDDGVEGIVDYDNHYEFNGLGELGSKATRKQARAERKAEKKAQKEANKKERKNAKGFFRKVGVAVKQGGKAFVKYNPALVVMRNSFLLIMRINLFGLAAKAKWGYATPEQAKKAGISDDKYKRSKKFISQLEKLYADKAGGSRASLKRNILSSKKAHLGSVVDLSGPEAAPIIAALPLVTAVVKLLVDNGLMSKKDADAVNDKVKNKDLNISDEDAKELENIQKEEESNDKKDDSSSGSSGKKGFMSKALDVAKEHPFLAVGTLLAASYFFIPPFKSFINGILKIGQKPPSLQGEGTNTLEGIGQNKSLPAPKTESKPKELKFITLK